MMFVLICNRNITYAFVVYFYLQFIFVEQSKSISSFLRALTFTRFTVHNNICQPLYYPWFRTWLRLWLCHRAQIYNDLWYNYPSKWNSKNITDDVNTVKFYEDLIYFLFSIHILYIWYDFVATWVDFIIQETKSYIET